MFCTVNDIALLRLEQPARKKQVSLFKEIVPWEFCPRYHVTRSEMNCTLDVYPLFFLLKGVAGLCRLWCTLYSVHRVNYTFTLTSIILPAPIRWYAVQFLNSPVEGGIRFLQHVSDTVSLQIMTQSSVLLMFLCVEYRRCLCAGCWWPGSESVHELLRHRLGTTNRRWVCNVVFAQ